MAGWKTQGTDFQKPLLNDAQHVDTTKDLEGKWVTRGWTTRDLLRVGVSAFPLGSPSQGLPMDARWTIGRRGTSKLGPVQHPWRGCSPAPSSTPLKRPKLPSYRAHPTEGQPSCQCLSPHLSPLAPLLQRGGSWPAISRSWGNRKSNLDFHIWNLCISDSDMPPEPLSTRLSCRPRPRPCPWPSSPRSGSRRPPSPSCAAGPCACSFPRRAPP